MYESSTLSCLTLLVYLLGNECFLNLATIHLLSGYLRKLVTKECFEEKLKKWKKSYPFEDKYEFCLIKNDN